MSPSPSLLSFSSCCRSEWKGTIDHVSNVARWMSARRGRARDVRCLGTASIAAAEVLESLTIPSALRRKAYAQAFNCPKSHFRPAKQSPPTMRARRAVWLSTSLMWRGG
ncbi:hypothetical protein E1A91_A04G135000v1 [Gossypium mustelinum]|uniref:Uncharacterized protein n=1 Tax=Gossypium mustelinum TaxID=34275 RepID=A0A5D2ZN55_GOSMU|nr:hypothetical protein E1A91_A04G135000v1 [Gossypium mustelinum]